MNALGIFTGCLICGGVGSGMFAVPDWITEARQASTYITR